MLCHIDDVLIFVCDHEEHNARLYAVLTRLDTAGITLNAEKCMLGKKSVKKYGIRADPNKTSAILQMEAPRTVSELRRLMGMVNQFGKFSPTLAETSHPLRQLLSKIVHGCGAQVKSRPSQQLGLTSSSKLYLSMTQRQRPRYPPTCHHTDWVQSHCRNTVEVGDQFPSHPRS